LHMVADLLGRRNSFPPFRDHDSDALYVITLTAIDSHGLSASKTVRLRPKLARLSLKSSPEGAPLTYTGTAFTAPYLRQSAVGFETTISAAAAFEVGGRKYVFDHWSDGGARLHDISVPDAGVALVAVYRVEPPATGVTPSETPPDESDGHGPVAVGLVG